MEFYIDHDQLNATAHATHNDFLGFYNSPAGRKEFKGNKTKLTDITRKKVGYFTRVSVCFDKFRARYKDL